MISQIEIDKIKKRLSWLKDLCYNNYRTIDLKILETKTYCSYKEAQTMPFKKIDSDKTWGENWGAAWFKGNYEISSDEAEIVDSDKEKILLAGETGGESLVYIDGKPVASFDKFHKKIPLHKAELTPGKHEVFIQSYAGHNVPSVTPKPEELRQGEMAEEDFLYDLPAVFKYCRLEKRDEVLWNIYFDLSILFETALQLPKNNLRRNQLLKKLSYYMDEVTWDTMDKSLRKEELKKIAAKIQPELEKENSKTTPNLNLIGHAHIDIAWLWPLNETKYKCARTFATQLRMLKEYEEYMFLQSQAKSYKFIEENYPEMFSRIQKEIKRGNWEVEGAMWVEADTNLTSAESLIRQIMYGKQYFQEKFDVESRILWLPDVFGYSGNLPQILKGCEVDYFITSKIGWNDTNRFPYDLFNWQGIDGSEVLTHFIKRTYNGSTDPQNLQKTWREFIQPEDSDEMIHAVGHGDGGGGITMEQLEYAHRAEDLEGLPKAKFGSVRSLMERLEKNREEYPTWQGELYLEFHRGTFTTQAWTKRNNRKLELLLRRAEYSAALAYLQGNSYPHETLKECWENLLTNQFHDILPGSSIKEVYEDCREMYGEAARKAESILESSLKKLDSDDTEKIKENEKHSYLSSSSEGPNQTWQINVWNTLLSSRDDLLELPLDGELEVFDKKAYKIGDHFLKRPRLNLLHEDKFTINVRDRKGRRYPFQLEEKHLFIDPGVIPGLGSKQFEIELREETDKSTNERNASHTSTGKLESKEEVSIIQTKNYYIMENKYIKVKFDYKGNISSFYDKELNREFISEGELGNKFIVAEDLPRDWDAWDIEKYYRKTENTIENMSDIEIIARGPLQVSMEISKDLGENSTLKQKIILNHNKQQLDFKTWIAWQENHQLLKVCFPTNIHTDKALYDIQGGYLERSTHENTSWDRAQFEVCAHKWAMLKENNCGIALLNDSKYGYESIDNELRLTLLKSPKGPDPEADMCEHYFEYSLLSVRSFSEGRVIKEARELNETHTISDGFVPDVQLPFSWQCEGIVLLSMKLSEKGKSIILRLNEKLGERNIMKLEFNEEPEKVAEVNMLEKEEQIIESKSDNTLELEFLPFEIKTLELGFK